METWASGPSGKMCFFPTGSSFLCHQFNCVVVFTSGEKLGKAQWGNFGANFGPIFRTVTRRSCNHDLQGKNSDVNDVPDAPAKSWAAAGQVFKVSVPTSEWENEGHLLLGWFNVQTTKRRLLPQNVHRCAVLEPLLGVASVGIATEVSVEDLGGGGK